jgi:hypothetical protein
MRKPFVFIPIISALLTCCACSKDRTALSPELVLTRVQSDWYVIESARDGYGILPAWEYEDTTVDQIARIPGTEAFTGSLRGSAVHTAGRRVVGFFFVVDAEDYQQFSTREALAEYLAMRGLKMPAISEFHDAPKVLSTGKGID